MPRSWMLTAATGLGLVFHRLDRRRRETAVRNVCAAFPLRTEVECREIVGTALLLGTDAGSYITGTSITVDGGTVVKSF